MEGGVASKFLVRPAWTGARTHYVSLFSLIQDTVHHESERSTLFYFPMKSDAVRGCFVHFCRITLMVFSSNIGPSWNLVYSNYYFETISYIASKITDFLTKKPHHPQNHHHNISKLEQLSNFTNCKNKYVHP